MVRASRIDIRICPEECSNTLQWTFVRLCSTLCRSRPFWCLSTVLVCRIRQPEVPGDTYQPVKLL